MKTTFLSILISSVVIISQIEKVLSIERKCGSVESLISGGEPIQFKQWPWMAALFFGPLFICGGTIGKY